MSAWIEHTSCLNQSSEILSLDLERYKGLQIQILKLLKSCNFFQQNHLEYKPLLRMEHDEGGEVG